MKQLTNEELLKITTKDECLNIKCPPILIVLDGVDGVGKTTVVKNLLEQLREKDDLKCTFNTFKRRRRDNPLFTVPTQETEYLFRSEVVSEINRRIVTFDEETEIIIIDKSPYSEYYYQHTPCFDRGTINPYQNHILEREIFKYKEILDNAIVIFLENDKCWKNYIKRETKKEYASSYSTLKKKEYLQMVESFAQNYKKLYKQCKCIKVANDQKSWKQVYNEVKSQIEERQKDFRE